MAWCKYCVRDCPVDRDHASGYICCTECGRILYQDVFTDEPTFTKGPAGESRMNGVFVRSVQNDYSESFKRTLENGKRQIRDLMIKLQIPDESLGIQAASFYRIAVDRSFTRGRRTAHVSAACLYIACRANDKPYLLIDFAIWLSVNVYVLGAVYLQLCKLLSLEEHPFVQKPVDPSLFMHRFTSALMKGDYKNKVLKTALQMVASMKRDWMQTGRKPSGICGAALYISALSHGFSYSKSEIVKIVHICEATLTKRLVEFENTKSGSLTIEEFTQNAEEFERENGSTNLPEVSNNDGKTEMLCQHKGKEPHFAHGLCRSCYKDFLELSGGLDGGSEPPSFQVAEMDRLAQAAEKETQQSSYEGNQDTCNTKKDAMPESENASTFENLDANCDDTMGKDGENPSLVDETDNLSDIDDVELNFYLNSEEESRFKKIIWEEMNKEYLEEQAAKEAAAAAAKMDFGEASGENLAAKELAAAAAAAVAKTREQRRQKRALEAKNAGPAQTAAEATRQMLTKKRLSSKINYDVLEKLFDENLPPSTKKPREQSLDEDNASDKGGEEDSEVKKSDSNKQDENEEHMEGDNAEAAGEDQLYDQNEYYYDEDDTNFFDDY